MKKVLCLHAAEANKQLIDEALSQHTSTTDIELHHIVNVELMALIREKQPLEVQTRSVHKTMVELIEQTPDLIFITCTNYIALLEDIALSTTIPIIKIDGLLFHECFKSTNTSVKLLFTNEHTIAGTLARAHKFNHYSVSIEPLYIPLLFDMYLLGQIEEHDALLLDYLKKQDFTQDTIAVGQLSMARAAHKGRVLYKLPIIDAASAFITYLEGNKMF